MEFSDEIHFFCFRIKIRFFQKLLLNYQISLGFWFKLFNLIMNSLCYVSSLFSVNHTEWKKKMLYSVLFKLVENWCFCVTQKISQQFSRSLVTTWSQWVFLYSMNAKICTKIKLNVKQRSPGTITAMGVRKIRFND